MLKNFIIRIISLSFLVVLVLTQNTMAWGPERDTFTNESPAPYATFNSITNNGLMGDERDFVRIYELDSLTNELDEVFDINKFSN